MQTNRLFAVLQGTGNICLSPLPYLQLHLTIMSSRQDLYKCDSVYERSRRMPLLRNLQMTKASAIKLHFSYKFLIFELI